MRTPSVILVAGGCLLLLGCEADEPAEQVTLDQPVASEPAEASQTQSYPDTTAEAVYAYLQQENYAQQWEL